MFTWIIEHVFFSLPTWIWPLIAVVGFVINSAAGIITALPGLKLYKLPLEIVGFVIFVIGLFLAGGAYINGANQQAIKDLQAKVDAAATASKSTNVEIHTVYVDRVKVVKDTQVKVVHDIQRDAAEMDKECKVDSAAISDLNEAAKGDKK